MADEKIVAQMVFEVLNKASADLKNIADDIGNVGEKSQQAERGGLQRFTAGLMDVKAGFEIAMQAGRAFVGVFQQTIELGKQVGAIQRAENAFRNLSGSEEEAAANLKAMMDATDNTLSKLDAMASGAKLMSMGLASNSDELGELTEMAVTLGRAFGRDATTAIDEFSLLLANQSKLRLDTFGISSARVTERINELKAAGMEANAAFMQATFEEGRIAMERLGEQAEDTATKMEQAEAAMADAKAAAMELTAGPLNNVATGLAAIARAATDIPAAMQDVVDRTSETAGSAVEFEAAIGGAIITTKQMVNALWETSTSFDDFQTALRNTRNPIYALYAEVNGLTEEWWRLWHALNSGAPIVDEWATSRLGRLTDGHKKTRAAVEELTEAEGDYAASLRYVELGAEASERAERKLASAERERAAALGEGIATREAAIREREYGAALGETFDALLQNKDGLDDLVTRHGDVIRVLASTTAEQETAVLATIRAEEAAEGLADAEKKLAENTDPEKQRELEKSVLMARQAFRDATEAAGDLNKSLTDGYTYTTDMTDKLDQELARALYNAAGAAGASASSLAALAISTGDFTKEEIEAALQTAIMQEKIGLLARGIAEGKVTIGEARQSLIELRNEMLAVPEEKTIKMKVDTSEADAAISRLKKDLGGIQDKAVTVTVNEKHYESHYPYAPD